MDPGAKCHHANSQCCFSFFLQLVLLNTLHKYTGGYLISVEGLQRNLELVSEGDFKETCGVMT